MSIKYYRTAARGVIRAVLGIGNRLWVHVNLHPNFDFSPKNKNNVKPEIEFVNLKRSLTLDSYFKTST